MLHADERGAFLLLFMRQTPRLVLVFCAVGGAALKFVPFGL
jgi:hypothetical protein